MPNRILRDGILSSEAVCSLGWAAEVFYRRLMSVVDDHGRFHASPKLLRAACYPLQIDKVSDADIGKWTTECVAAALVSVYPAQDGKRYVQVEKFGQQVRSKSKYPEPVDINSTPPLAPDIPCKQLLADAHLGVVGVEGVVGGVEQQASQAPPSTRGSRLPGDWTLPDGWGEEGNRARAEEGLPPVNPKSEAGRFRDYWHAQAGQKGVKLDWLATWRNWCRNARVKGSQPSRPSRLTTPTSADHEAAGSGW